MGKYNICNILINIWKLTEDDQSILIETSSCNLQFFSELITTNYYSIENFTWWHRKLSLLKPFIWEMILSSEVLSS